jgi:hypothetical protein
MRGGNLLAPAGARPVFAEHYPFEALVRERPAAVQRAVVAGSAKLVRGTDGAAQLFDLTADPRETADRAAADPEAAAALEAVLEAWLAATEVGGTESAPLDPELSERLEALGYVQ